MNEKEFIEKLRNSTFESVELLSENQKVFTIRAIDLYNDFILVAETGKFSSGFYLSELNILLCNNHIDVNIFDTIYNIFLSITASMLCFKEFKLKQIQKERRRRGLMF